MARKRRIPKPTAAREIAMPAPQEFGQHHEVETRSDRVGGVQGWRVRTRLDALLLVDQRIDAAEWQAGDNYRRDLEVGELGGRIAAIGDHGVGGDGCPTVSRLTALARLGDARKVLTVVQRQAMDGLVADLSWPMLGERIGCGRKAAVSMVVGALALLAEHYKLRSKAGRIRAAAFV